MLRAVASRGGGPGCSWHQESKRLWQQSRPTLSTGNTFHWNPLTVMNDDDDTHNWNQLTSGSTYGWDGGMAELDELPSVSQCGYQNRDTHGGTSRGARSQAAKSRRHDRWQQKQLAPRQDYREWRRSQTGSTLRTHGGSFLKPPICSQPAIERLTHISRKADSSFNQLRFCNKQSAPSLPSGTQLTIATWNVEGLKEVAKYDQLIVWADNLQIHRMATQGTKSDSSYMFRQSGWEILHSCTPAGKHHGVGLFVSPNIRPHVSNFLAQSPRICEITLNVHPHPIKIFSISAPSTVEDSQEDVETKIDFWEWLDSIIDDNKTSKFILLGDLNSRLSTSLDSDQSHIGPHVRGKRQPIPDPDRGDAEYLLSFLQSRDLFLRQTYIDLPIAQRVS